MKKLFCIILTLALLLPVLTGCKARDEKKIEKMLACRMKVTLGIASRDEIEAVYSDAYWAKREGTETSLDAHVEGGGRLSLGGGSAMLSDTVQQTTKEDHEQMLKDEFGEKYKITAEITSMEEIDKAYLEKHAEQIKLVYHYDVKIDAAYDVTYKIKISGDKKTTELDEVRIPVYKIDGRWCLA